MKKEYVTPVPKGKPSKAIKLLADVGKIESTSDFSQIFENFVRDLIMEDVSEIFNK